MRMVVDWRRLSGDLLQQRQQFEAVAATVRDGGVGEVVVSARKKIPEEKGKKVLHGRDIANLLRRIGHDPFAYPDSVSREAQRFIAEQTNAAVMKAWENVRSYSDQVKAVLYAQAEELATWAAENIAAGGLGKSVGRYGKRKAILANQGRRGVTKKYGSPPPVGVYTGRFLDGIRSRWRAKRGAEDA